MNKLQALRHYFHLESFRIGQEDIIDSVLAKQNTLGMLPTGTGKSLCYQLPGYLLDGTVLIISPLLSLMQDQVEQLGMMGEKRAVALNSFLTGDEREQALNRLESYKFIYMAPEMLSNTYLLKRLKTMNISLFVVDEAHCISQWGPDFRPDYLSLGRFRKLLGEPTLLALTATAAPEVRLDIKKRLQLEDMNEIVYSVDRKNIAMAVIEEPGHFDKQARVIDLALRLEKPGIIYFSSKRLADEMAEELRKAGLPRTASYHGGMDYEQRILIQQQFVYGQLEIICATSAFGMGVNKEDIRFVIHFHMPGQAESYLQEVGRAGRDGKQSVAILLYADGDEYLPLQLLDGELPSEAQIDAFFRGVAPEMLGLTDIQERFLEFYKSREDQFADSAQGVKEIRADRIAYKRKKLAAMKSWLNTGQCRREKLLSFFDEQPGSKPQVCCDCCGLELSQFEQTASSSVPEGGIEHNWELVLGQLLRERVPE